MEINNDAKIFEMQAEVCLAIANPKRLHILSLLKNSEMSVAALIQAVAINKANMSQHLAVLRQHNIIEARREGKTIYYRIANPKITEACTIMRGVLMETLKEKAKLSKRLQKVKL
jgi:ArsR family transcriptional regulator